MAGMGVAPCVVPRWVYEVVVGRNPPALAVEVRKCVYSSDRNWERLMSCVRSSRSHSLLSSSSTSRNRQQGARNILVVTGWRLFLTQNAPSHVARKGGEWSAGSGRALLQFIQHSSFLRASFPPRSLIVDLVVPAVLDLQLRSTSAPSASYS